MLPAACGIIGNDYLIRPFFQPFQDKQIIGRGRVGAVIGKDRGFLVDRQVALLRQRTERFGTSLTARRMSAAASQIQPSVRMIFICQR